MSDAKYFVEVAPVREVTLLGTSDLEYWREHLASEHLQPAIRDDRAEMMISACSAKYCGIPFRELSISVFVAQGEDKAVRNRVGRNGAFMLHAFNSLRLFAWVERRMFATPYYPAKLHISADLPVEFQAAQQGTKLLRAAMDATSRDRVPLRNEPDGWEGPIFLPSPAAADGGNRKLFFARLRGETQTYSFAADDIFEISTGTNCGAIEALRASHFQPTEWIVRTSAAHAKSKTRSRTDPV